MNDVFNYCIDWLFRPDVEGDGTVTEDQGGLTKYGISQRAYPDLDIANLSREKAAELYRRDYWDRAKCGKFPPVIAMILMDAAVNAGVRQGWILLQRAINAALVDHSIGVDGMAGPETISAVLALDKCGRLEILATAFIEARGAHYKGLAKDQPKMHGSSLKGWLNRLARLEIAIKNIPGG